jgi:uncharacterized oxidoreductase
LKAGNGCYEFLSLVMRLSGNTILITGGTSGIGFELAAQLLKLGNVVIVTGRDQRRIEETQRELPGVRAFQSDVTDPKAIALLCDAVITEFPGLNMLFNNAGIMRETNLLGDRASGDLEDISREIETDLIGPIRMVKQFLPHLLRQPASTIVNVSSGLAFVPLPIAPIYCSAKAGLHSFTLSLRVQLRNTRVKVFELAPPMTRTPLFAKDMRAQDGVRMMAVDEMVRRTIRGLKNDRLEIRPGMSNVLKLMSRLAPTFILNRLSKSVDER